MAPVAVLGVLVVVVLLVVVVVLAGAGLAAPEAGLAGVPGDAVVLGGTRPPKPPRPPSPILKQKIHIFLLLTAFSTFEVTRKCDHIS